MAVEIPESVKESLVLIAGALGAVGVLFLLIGGSHQVAMGLAALCLMASLYAFIEARLIAHEATAPVTKTISRAPVVHVSAHAQDEVSQVKAPVTPLQLQKARLDGARLDGLNFTGASLIELSAVGADMRHVIMHGANLTGANLKDVNLAGVNLDEVNLTKGRLDGGNLSGVQASSLTLQGATLEQTRLSKSRISHSDLREIKGPRLDMNSSTLEHVNLMGARLERADLRQVAWDEIDLRQASLLECKLQDGVFTGLMARAVKMPGCVADGVTAQGADFRDALMFKASFKGADLRESLWDGADLRDVDLSEANLSEASLKGVNLSGANLSGANLMGANLLDTDLSTCIHNMLTTWPEGVEPSQLISTLDEASLPEIVEEPRAAVISPAEPEEVEEVEEPAPVSKEGDEDEAPRDAKTDRPSFNIKNIPKIHIRKPARAVQKTMPLDDQDLQLMHEGIAATPPPLTTSEEDSRADEALESEEHDGEDSAPESTSASTSDDEPAVAQDADESAKGAGAEAHEKSEA